MWEKNEVRHLRTKITLKEDQLLRSKNMGEGYRIRMEILKLQRELFRLKAC